MLKDFKAFILRGNVIDLAVAVAIGAAFTAVITSFTRNIVMPLIAIPGDAADFTDYTFEISGAVFRYGLVINAIIIFLITAALLFFVVVRPINQFMAKRRTEPDVDTPTRECPECMSSIPEPARRCAFCTAVVTG